MLATFKIINVTSEAKKVQKSVPSFNNCAELDSKYLKKYVLGLNSC